MSKVFVLTFFFFLSTNVFSQNTSGVKVSERTIYTKYDTIPVFVKQSKFDNGKKPLIEINGKLSSSGTLSSFDNQSIKSIFVEKKPFDFSDETYEGKIKIELKPDAKVNLMTVSELISKYTDLKTGEKYIYSIDGEIVNDDEKSSLVDERNIMLLKVVRLDHLKSVQNLSFVKIITRTKANISKANEIIIR